MTSFIFEARDGGPLAPFSAGQHLPIELAIPGTNTRIERSYSLSNSPGEDRYRISVKREPNGLVSRLLHDAAEPGAMIESRRPAGEFTLTGGTEPVVLVSAGIGITPLLSLLHQLATEGGRRPVWFVHGARDGDHHPFQDEVAKLAAARSGITVKTFYSKPTAADVIAQRFDGESRLSARTLVDIGVPPNARFYLCGPAGFLSDLQTGLADQGVSEDRVHVESF